MLYFKQVPTLTADEQAQFDEVVEKYISHIMRHAQTKLEQVRMVHQIIQENVIYPYQRLRQIGAIGVPTLPDTPIGKHHISAYGALVNGRANSYGIARAVDTLLCHPQINIPCSLVEGCIYDEREGMTTHLWDIVTINGCSYHVDTTSDIIYNPQSIRRTGKAGKPLSRLESFETAMVEVLSVSYDYCLVSDDVMAVNHIWDKSTTKRCLSSCYIVKRA